MSTEAFYSHELIDWSQAVEFYLEESTTFEKWLDKVVKTKSESITSALIEHFQNIFVAQKEALLSLQNAIIGQKERLANDIRCTAQFNDLDTVDAQFILRERIQKSEKMFLENKHSFYHFLVNTIKGR